MTDWEAVYVRDATAILAEHGNETDRQLFKRMVSRAKSMLADNTRVIPKRRRLDTHADGVVMEELALILQNTVGYTRAFWSHTAHVIAKKERDDLDEFIKARAS